MITRLTLQNFGPLARVDWEKLARINLIIGGNGAGKTFLLKSLYTAMRTLEEYRRGSNPKSAADILLDKLHWTYQADKIGDLVTKGASEGLAFKCWVDDQEFTYGFGKDTTKQIQTLENHVPPRSSNSIFLPAKEVLSLQPIILRSRDTEQEFGFDDTYLDLARALGQSTQKGKNYVEFAKSRKHLETILGGKIEYDVNAMRWQFRKGNQRFPIGVAAEGIKKIAILDTLLGNRYLDPGSIIFIDEPESALHPAALSEFLDIVTELAKRGIQFFLASHSYFVIKKLYLIARENEFSVPILMANGDDWHCADLRDGMPENAIIDESIRLYKEEVDLAFK
jgi:AAA15 family ATPase/GTPase